MGDAKNEPNSVYTIASLNLVGVTSQDIIIALDSKGL